MPARVLIADDYDQLRRLMRRALETAGYDVTDAADGPSADAALACGGFACAVLDNRMPEPTGVQVAAAARARGDATPILIVSGSITSDDLAAVAPPTYLLGKPFEFTALVALIDQLVRRGVADRSVTDTPRPPRRGWLRWSPR
ncbi:MAG TPA: response regulator [Gemmataceae bacterium]|nr:response regulator [Gemmataceae bacterium]